MTPWPKRRRTLRLLVFASAIAAGIIVGRTWRRPSTLPAAEPSGGGLVDAKVPPPAGVAPTPGVVAAARSETKPTSAAAGLTLPSALQLEGALTLGEALRALARMADDGQRTEYFQALLRFGAERDPAGTVALAAALEEAKLRDLGVGFVLTQWAQADAAAALRWAVEHPRGENDAMRFFAAFEGFASRDPLAAVRWVERPEFAGDVDELARIAIFHAQASGRLAEARAEIEKLPEGNVRDLFVRQVVRVWAQQAPGEAANWLASVASDATFRAGMGTLVQTIGDRDPQFAAGLTQQFRDPRIREEYLADVIYVWARRDLGGAAAWLRSQPPGANLDAAIARMAEETAKFDRVEATTWINTMSDAAKREELRRRLNLGG